MKILLVIILLCTSVCSAQTDGQDDKRRIHPATPAPVVNPAGMQSLKTSNPKLYEQIMKQTRRQEAVSRIVAQFRKGELSKDDAKDKLKPLVSEEFTPEKMDQQIKNTRMLIDSMQKRLKSLEAAKEDPSSMVDERINSMLSMSTAPPPGIKQ